jgi:hypothetical protein
MPHRTSPIPSLLPTDEIDPQPDLALTEYTEVDDEGEAEILELLENILREAVH